MNHVDGMRSLRSPLSLVPFVIVSLLLHAIMMRFYVSFPDTSIRDKAEQQSDRRQVTVETLHADHIPDFLKESSGSSSDEPSSQANNRVAVQPAQPQLSDDGGVSSLSEEQQASEEQAAVIRMPSALSSSRDGSVTGKSQTALAAQDPVAVDRSRDLRYDYTREAFRDIAADAPLSSTSIPQESPDDPKTAAIKEYHSQQQQRKIDLPENLSENIDADIADSLSVSENTTTLSSAEISSDFPGLSSSRQSDMSTMADDTIISVAPLLSVADEVSDDSRPEDIIVAVTPPKGEPRKKKRRKRKSEPLIQYPLTVDPPVSNAPVSSSTTLNHSSGAVLGYIKRPARAPAIPPVASVRLPQNKPTSELQASSSYQRPPAASSFKRGAAAMSVRSYTQLLSAWVAKFQKRPSSVPAFVRGKGTVLIDITRGGRVLHAKVTRSSGSAALDKAALRMVHAASPVTPVPSDFRPFEQTLSFAIPFTF